VDSAPLGLLVLCGGERVVSMRAIFILNEILAHDKIYVYFGTHFAWLKKNYLSLSAITGFELQAANFVAG
jgi:hypothetical protein